MTDERNTNDDANDGALSTRLRDAVVLLRDTPDTDRAWRARVVRAALDAHAPQRARSHTRAWIALAAGFAGMIAGGSGVYLAMRSGQRSSSAPPLTGAVQAQFTNDVRVRFTLRAPAASTVSVVGDFNHWDPVAFPLKRSADGTTWEIDIPLRPGRYTYSFLVDGVLARDPVAPQVRDDDFGSSNSVLMVRGS